MTAPPLLSICIATHMRGDLLGATLQSIVPQLDARCELVIVDGASPDGTELAVEPFRLAHANVRYVREEGNSGVDRDYDKAVGYARGRYCWLMTDDDLLTDGAVGKVLDALADEPDLLVVNSEVRTADFSAQLKPWLLSPEGPARYDESQAEAFFVAAARYLSFIGAVVVRRAVWLARRRDLYYGSHFIHVGVIFQAPALQSVRVIREPLIVIRYGNAMWSPRGFDIWMFKWPALIWSFTHFTTRGRQAVTASEPFRLARNLFWYRGTGGYAVEVYERCLSGRVSRPASILPWLVARLPPKSANALCGIYCWLRFIKPARMAVYDLARADARAALTLALARRLRVV